MPRGVTIPNGDPSSTCPSPWLGGNWDGENNTNQQLQNTHACSLPTAPIPPVRNDSPISLVERSRRSSISEYSSSNDGLRIQDFEAVLATSKTKDVTVHVELSIAEDLDGLLETFCRLKRLGHFLAAEQYFKENLQRYLEVPPVMIEYADMLLEQGNYNAINQLNLEDRSFQFLDEPGYTQHAIDYKLLQTIASIHYHGNFKWAQSYFDEWETHIHELISMPISLSSLQIRHIRYILEILSDMKLHSSFLKKYPAWIKSLSNVYERLRNEGRVWDVHDLLIAAANMDTSHNRWIDNEVLSIDGLSKFLQYWTLGAYDESTYLALLDVFSVLSIACMSTNIYPPNEENTVTAKRYLLCARDLATCIQKNSLSLIKSRPYIRWILAEESFTRMSNSTSSGDLKSHLANFPGIVIWVSTLPIYIPLKRENPGWPSSSDKPFNISLLTTALKVSQELQDLRMEALCR
ncbi:uncharacterized protein TRUGW13939_01238 [Talaromyces rugulosus]|uniref:Uncharacterized protein n=1 Tax=Talaromyces rugulosus TaxID=121627 RepID=A0A7H8QJN7_TALRU|nr:uncharacterized protein TRUGW13939_01238 [Talaromyces rugulosus]QKX54154.1 hypothetical protein TRUGW13939_01238 [Talaromyces rugulosus]